MRRGSRGGGAAKVIPIRERGTSPVARVGRIVDVLPDGTPRVRLEAGAEPVAARALEPLDAGALRAAAARGAEVLLTLVDGDPTRPIVTGILAAPPDPTTALPAVRVATPPPASVAGA